MKELKNELLNLNLRLFEGAAAGSGTAATGDGTGEGASETTNLGETTKKTSVAKKGKAANPLANVQYGIQANQNETIESEDNSTAGTEHTKPAKTLEERKAEYERLVKSEYKDLYTEETQNMINKRFKETKTYESQLNAISPMIEILSSKYGVDANDLNKLAEAIQEDESFYEDEAMERGLTVDQLKQMKKMERENKELKRAFEDKNAREQANRTYSEWLQQGEQLKTVYPSFNLNTECSNPQFVKLLQSNIDVKTAYEVIHHGEIIGGAMQYTAQQIQQKVVNNIKARGMRPTENGISSNSAVVTKNDVHALTKQDRAEIARRVARGEKISF